MKRLYPIQPIVGIGVVIMCDGKILLAKRGNEPSKGKWAVPGGLVELGETLEQAVIRETEEETCLQVQNPQVIDVIDNVDKDTKGIVRYHYVIIDYLVTVKCGSVRAASDVSDLRWVSLNEVESYDLTSSFRVFFIRNKEKLANV